jgi:hypothetical protein
MDPHFSEDALANATREEIMSALFANMVVQQSQMAMMLMGKIPHPETGQSIQDIEGAKMFIDQLEMIEFKTKGNLDAREEELLKQNLTTLRMTFVETIEGFSNHPPASDPAPAQKQSNPPSEAAASAPQNPADENQPHKKFSRKY